LQPLGFSNNGTLRGRVVFAGYGITAPGYDWDDYAGLDVHDAVVLVLTQEPGEMDSTSRFDGNLNTPFADLRTRLRADPGWQVHDLPTGHNAMREAPEATAALLLGAPAAGAPGEVNRRSPRATT